MTDQAAWRAVPILGVTQILAWGAIYYTPVLIAPRIAAERGWSMSLAMGGFSVGLLVAGLCAPRVGALIDRHGGHGVMAGGSLLGAGGLLALVVVHGAAAYLGAWVLLGMAMSASLYDPAFASLGRMFGTKARKPITALTLIGGFASTVSWPVTHLLLERLDWRLTYVLYAALLALIAAPLHAFALPRSRAEALASPSAAAPAAVLPARGWPLLLVATAFTAYAFVPSGMAAHMLGIFDRLGLETSTVVAIGALFGPSQVAARLCEFVFARNVHPLRIARGALVVLVAAFGFVAVAGLSVGVAALIAVLYGGANGLMTIARGTVPLALFGARGFGATVGRLGGPALVMQAVAPFVLAAIIEHGSDTAALFALGGFSLIALACFALIRRAA